MSAYADGRVAVDDVPWRSWQRAKVWLQNSISTVLLKGCPFVFHRSIATRDARHAQTRVVVRQVLAEGGQSLPAVFVQQRDHLLRQGALFVRDAAIAK